MNYKLWKYVNIIYYLINHKNNNIQLSFQNSIVIVVENWWKYFVFIIYL